MNHTAELNHCDLADFETFFSDGKVEIGLLEAGSNGDSDLVLLMAEPDKQTGKMDVVIEEFFGADRDRALREFRLLVHRHNVL